MPGAEQKTAGTSYALLANLTSMLQVLYWPLLTDVPVMALLAHRSVWSTVVCIAVVVAVRRWREVVQCVRNRQQLLALVSASLVLAAAWGTYIFAVNTSQVTQSSLGLYLIPLTTAIAGVMVFQERLSVWQWGAVACAALATLSLAFTYGTVPWITLTLAVLMAFYAVLKKLAAAPALPGCTVECLVLVPCALVYLQLSHQESAVEYDVHTLGLLFISGLLTAVPLIAHAASIERISLTVIGFLQYLNPTGQLLIGIAVGSALVTPAHWIAVVAIWCAVAVFLRTGEFYARTGPSVE